MSRSDADVIDALVGIAPGSALDALRARRPEARAHALTRKYGAARIAMELRAKGLDKGLAERTLAAARSSEVERAQAVWAKKFKNPGSTREERAKQMRFLQSRGFSFDAIRTVIRGADED